MQAILSQAMQAPENWVVSLEYVDSRGAATRRVVSPIRFMSGGRFLGLCLCREEPRQFYLNRCRRIQLRRAEDYVMPVPVTALDAESPLMLTTATGDGLVCLS
jgi:predicted DNA-binding transcriptional regulator YafY